MASSGDCTATAACPVPHGFLSSPPSLAGSVVFLVAFATLIPASFVTGMRYSTSLYSSTVIAGLLFEAVGYAGRLFLSSNVASVPGFVLYMLGTVMGPTFVTSAIYQILPHIVVLYGPEFTIISQPIYFRLMFMACDILTLAFQAGGISFAVTGGTRAQKAQGINLLLAGLGMQLASITLFLCIYWYFVYSLHHRRYILDPTFQVTYLSPKFKVFLLCMQLSTILILARTIARFISLLGGWTNPLAQSALFPLLLDGVPVLLATAILTTVSPGAAFGPSWAATSPQFAPAPASTVLPSSRSSSGSRRHRPAHISLPVSSSSPLYRPVGHHHPPPPSSASSSLPSSSPPPFPTPPLLRSLAQGHSQQLPLRSPPYPHHHHHHYYRQSPGVPPPPPPKDSPGFAVHHRPAPCEVLPGQLAPLVASPGLVGVQAQSSRRQQAGRSLVLSDALW